MLLQAQYGKISPRMKKQEDILKEIHEVGKVYLSKKTIDEAYRTVVKEALSHYEGLEGSILIAEGDELKRIYASSPLFYNIKVKKNDIKFKAYKTLTPLLVSGKEYKIDEKDYPFLKKLKIRSIILIPLSYAYKRVGIFVVWSKRAKPKMNEKSKIIKLLGFIAHLSIQKLESQIETLERDAHILENIYDSTLKFLAPLNLEDTYRKIIEESIKLTRGEYGTIYWEKDSELHRVFSNMPRLIELRKGGYRYRVFKEGKSMVLNKRKLNTLKVLHPELEEIGARSVLVVPLVNEGKSVGLLTIDSRKDERFTEKDLEILKLFGSLASISIKKALLYEEIKQSLENRDLFISLASHELRTPLTTIDGYIQLLLSKIGERKPIDNKWILELAFESQRMKNLIDEFLEINRIRVGKMQFNFGEVSLTEVVDHAVATLKFNYPQRKLELKNSLPKKDLVIGDSDKLHQVFMNILENAVRYSGKDRKIRLNLRKSSEYFEVKVSDEGGGISEKDLPNIFKGFYKGQNSKHEGMGLGLFLAKNILDAHRGQIDIHSKPGIGTNVTVKLPKYD